MSNELTKKTGRAVAWSTSTEVITKLIVPFTNMLLARLLTPEAYGAVATISIVITFAELFTDAGFQKYVVQHEFKSEAELDRGTNVAFWTNFSISLLAVLLIALFRNPLAEFVGSPGLGTAMVIASSNIILVSFSSIQRARFRRALDFKSLFYLRVSATLIPFLVTIPLAFALRNYWALIIGDLAHKLFNAIFLWMRSSWKPRFFYDFSLFKEMFSYTIWILLESITIWLTGYVDIFILGKILSDYYLGIYKVSSTTVIGYMTLVTTALMPVLFSALSRYQKDDENFNKTYWLFFKYTSLLIIPMGIGVFVYRDWVRTILLGAQWEEATLYLGLSGLANGLTIPLTYLPSEVYRSKGYPKLSMFSQMVLIITLIPLVLFASQYSFKVLYIARCFVPCIVGILTHALLMHFKFGFRISKTIKTILPFLASSAVMAAAGVWFVRISSLMSSRMSMLWQTVSIVWCVIIYFAVLFVCFPKIRREVLEASFVKKVLAKIRKQQKEA